MRIEAAEWPLFLCGLIDRFNNFDHDFGDTFVNHVDFFGSTQRQIQDASFDEGATVIDFENDRATIAQVCNSDHGTQWQFAMCGRETVHVKNFATGCGATMKFVCVVRCVADLVRFVLLALFGVVWRWRFLGFGFGGYWYFLGFGWRGFGAIAGM